MCTANQLTGFYMRATLALNGLMKDELGGKIIQAIVALRPKVYSYLTDDDHVDKKTTSTKKCVIKQIKFLD